MKNIFLIPTDRPSRVHLIEDVLTFTNEYKNSVCDSEVNIYITSDEEIKEGDWYINTFVSEREQKPQTHTEKRHLINHQKDYRFKYCKKIILTTDQDLIKDGVQAIDDEFLEWFIKNPSCEEVEVERNFADEGIKGITYYGKYFLIIPKEKCTCENPTDNTCNYCNELEIKQILSKAELNAKQETLEEVKLKFCNDSINWQGSSREDLKLGWDTCAKWHAERSHSDEEVYNILEMAMISGYTEELETHYSGDFKNLKRWFEQFKKEIR